MREAQGLRVATATAMQKLTEEYEKLRGDSEAPPPKRRRSGVDVIPPSPVHRCVHDFDAEKASSLRIVWSNYAPCEALVVLKDVAAEDTVLSFQLILAEKVKVTAGVLPGRLTVESASWSCTASEELLWIDVIALNEHTITVFVRRTRHQLGAPRRFVRQELAHPRC